MKQTSITQKQLREFGLLIGIGFPVIIGWIIPALGGHLFRFWSLWFGIPILILGLIKPPLLLYPYKTWMVIGHVLGWVNSRIILGLVFILVLQPISLILKIFDYDPLKKKKRNVLTYREIKENSKVDFKRIF